MAVADRSVSPDLDNASRYADYREFRAANRERWEHCEAFVRLWQERLFRLAEKEGNRLGLRLDDLMSSWDRWYDDIVIPLQNVFWAGWEHSYDLPKRFAQAIHASAAAAPSCPGLQVAHLYLCDLTKLQGLSAEPTSEVALLCRSVARAALADAGYAVPGNCFAWASPHATVRSLSRDGGRTVQ
jgi:hypothetical protein